MKRAIDLCQAKWFLVDQSGSMNKDGEWNIAQGYYYPDSSRVCSFSEIIYNKTDDDVNKPIELYHTYDITTELAFGKTCYYNAGNVLLKLIPSKSILTSIINGGNNVGEDTSESIIKSAKDKEVIINHVGINLDENAKKDFIKITDETGGKYYFLDRFN